MDKVKRYQKKKSIAMYLHVESQQPQMASVSPSVFLREHSRFLFALLWCQLIVVSCFVYFSSELALTRNAEAIGSITTTQKGKNKSKISWSRTGSKLTCRGLAASLWLFFPMCFLSPGRVPTGRPSSLFTALLIISFVYLCAVQYC